MTKEELEAQALKLDPKERARLAGKLLESLESLSGPENAQLWAEEAQRRDADLDENPDAGRPADAVLNDARSRLK
jgi:putative addiction module component (TIGR02574 family)